MKLPILPLALVAGFLGGHLFIGLGGCRREPAAAPPPAVDPQPNVQALLSNSIAMADQAFDLGMCTGYLFAQRGGNPTQFHTARQMATTNREAVVFGTLNGTLLPPANLSISNAPPEPETPNPKPETQNSEPETPNPEPAP